jgi:hypothetical protein
MKKNYHRPNRIPVIGRNMSNGSRLNQMRYIGDGYPYAQDFSVRREKMPREGYSPLVKFVFRILKYFGFFLLGTCLAMVISSGLQIAGLTSLIIGLFSFLIAPVFTITVCTIAVAIVIESMTAK